MSFLRINIDFAIPEDMDGIAVLTTTDEQGKQVGGIKISKEAAVKLQAVRTAIQGLKSYVKKINEGLANEEVTTTAQLFICYHDDTKRLIPDGPRQEI